MCGYCIMYKQQVNLVPSIDYVKPLGIMITAHGRFVTTKRNREIPEEVEIEIPPTTIYSFSADGESCAYPLDSMMSLAKKMKNAYDGATRRITNESFLENVNQVQIDTIGYPYESKQWSGVFSRKPSFTGNVVKDTTKYFEKMFETSYDDQEGKTYKYKSGVYVFYKENERILDFYPIGSDVFDSETRYTLLSSILDYFSKNFGINRFYIFDATCSVVSVTGQPPEHYADTREKRHVANTIHWKKENGKGKRKKTRRPKRKKTRRPKRKIQIFQK